MYPLSQKPIRDRLHRQACERGGITEDTDLSRMPVTLRTYEEAVQDVAVERIAQLEEVLAATLRWLEAAVAGGQGNWGPIAYDTMVYHRDRLREANAGNTTTRQPDDG
jgi:hypothetical protein